MDALLRILTVLIAATALMSVASMLVATLVRYVLYLRRSRGKNTAEMLSAFNYGFRARQGDQPALGDEPSVAFALDVLADPVLHGPPTPREREQYGKLELEKQYTALKRELTRVDYVPIDVLKRIVSAHASGGVLPSSWHTSLLPTVATADAFNAYIEAEQHVIQGVSDDRFRTEAKRLTWSLSLLLVVVLHFDATDFVTRMLRSPASADTLASFAPDLLQVSVDTGLDQPLTQPRDDDDLLVELPWTQLLAVLNERDLGVGWQNSWYLRELCSYDVACARELGLDLTAAPTGFWKFVRFVRWLFGFALTWVLLGLGAPFWADRLRDLLNLRNSVAQRSAPRNEPSAPPNPPAGADGAAIAEHE